MAASIVLRTSDDTAQGFRSAANNVRDLSGSVGKAADQAGALNRELNETVQAARRAADAMEKMKGPSSGAGGGGFGGLSPTVMNGMSSAMTGIGTAAAGAAVAVLAIKAGLEAAKQVAETVAFALNELKEHGNEDASDLLDAFGELKSAFLDLGNDPVFRQMLVDSAAIIRDDIIPAIGTLTHTYTDAVDYITRELIGAQKILGLISAQAAADQFAALNDATKARDQNNAVQVAKERQAREDRKNAEAIKKAADELAKSQKEAADFQREIDKGHAEWLEKQDKERTERLKEQVRFIQDQQLAADKKVADRKAQLLADEREQKEQLWEREAQELAKKQQALQDPVKKLVDNQDPKKTRQQYAQNRLNKELAAFDAEADRQISGDGTPAGEKRALRVKLDRERANLEKRTRFNAFRQFDQGRARDDEVAQAQTDVAQGQVDMMHGQGKVSDLTATAMGNLLREQQQLKAEQDETAQAVEMILAAQRSSGQRRRGALLH